MIKGINFQPWISKNYETETSKYNRLLILGESHYIEEDDCEEQKDNEVDDNNSQVGVTHNNFTSAVVQDFLDDKHNIAFFRNLGWLFNPNDKKEIWKEIAFANAIQISLCGSTVQPSQNEIETVKNAFWLLLDNLEPDKILVCSKRMWNYWVPEDPAKCEFVRHINNNNKSSTIWKYKTQSKECLVMGINHPSKYFSYNNWRPIVMEFLNEAIKQYHL